MIRPRWRVTRRALQDYAELTGLGLGDAERELEERMAEAHYVSTGASGVAIYRLRGVARHGGTRYRLVISQDQAIVRVLPERSPPRRGRGE